MTYAYTQIGANITTTAVYQDPSISLNSNILAVCVTSTTAAIRVFRIESTGTLTELVINGLPSTQIGCVAVSPTGRYIFGGAAAANQPYARLWKYNSATDQYDIIHTGGVSTQYRAVTASWAPDESYVAIAASYDSSNLGGLTICGLDTATDTFYTTGTVNYVTYIGLAYRGLAVRVSPDSNYIAFCMANGSNGATQRSYIYLLNRTTTTWSVTEVLTVPAANSGAYISWNSDGSYLMIGRWANSVPNLQLVKQTGGSGLSKTYAIQGGLFTTNAARNPHYLKDNIFAAIGVNGINYWSQIGDTPTVTTTPTGLETISSIANVGMSDPISSTNYIAAHVSTTLRVYKAVQLPISGIFSYPVFGVSANVKTPIIITSGLNYSVFQAAGTLKVPLAINGDATFPVFAVAGSGGIFEAQYSLAYDALHSMIASVAQAEYSEVDPVETFGYGNLAYPTTVTDGLVTIISQTTGEFIYPTYGILGFLNIVQAEGDLLYPDGFTVNGEFYNLKEFSGDLVYPFFDVDANIKLSTTGSGELVYSEYAVNAVLTTTVINGDLVYPMFEVEGQIDVLYTEASGEFEYPSIEVASTVSLIDHIDGTLVYPAYEIDAEGDVPLWAAGDLTYQSYSLNGEINVPIGAMANVIYPAFATTGIVGVKVNINGDEAYPVFKVIGSVGFVLSGDGNLKYPLYQIDGYSGANPEIEGTVNYPIYGTNFNVENYYGVASNSVLEVESDDTVASIGPRKNLIITEH